MGGTVISMLETLQSTLPATVPSTVAAGGDTPGQACKHLGTYRAS